MAVQYLVQYLPSIFGASIGGCPNLPKSSASDVKAISTAAHELAEVKYMYDAFKDAGGSMSYKEAVMTLERGHQAALKHEKEILKALGVEVK